MNARMIALALLVSHSTCAVAVETRDAGAPELDSRITLKVDAEGKADYSGKDAKTQTRVLNITLSNSRTDKITGATIKWTIYGHTMAGHQLVLIKSGSMNKDLPVREPVHAASAMVKISGIREHSVRTTSGKGRNVHVTLKKVPASGHEYYGYAVQVFDRGKLLAESYSQPSIVSAVKPKS